MGDIHHESTIFGNMTIKTKKDQHKGAYFDEYTLYRCYSYLPYSKKTYIHLYCLYKNFVLSRHGDTTFQIFYLYVPFINSLTECHFVMMVDNVMGIFMAILLILIHTFGFSVTKHFWFCRYAASWMFLSLDFPFEYWIDQVTSGLLYVMLRLSTRGFYRGVPGFATNFSYGVWCRGLTTCLLYVGPLFGNVVWNNSGFARLT